MAAVKTEIVEETEVKETKSVIDGKEAVDDGEVEATGEIPEETKKKKKKKKKKKSSQFPYVWNFLCHNTWTSWSLVGGYFVFILCWYVGHHVCVCVHVCVEGRTDSDWYNYVRSYS